MNHSTNGILPTLGGATIGGAGVGLAEPTAAGPDFVVVETVDKNRGPVRIRFQRMKAKHNKHTHYFWCACYAELIEPQPPGDNDAQRS